MGEGNRNKSLFWAACRAAENGLMNQSAQLALVDAADKAGLPGKEAAKTIKSAVNYTQKNARITS